MKSLVTTRYHANTSQISLSKKILKRSEINIDVLQNRVVLKKEKKERGLDRVKASAIGRRSVTPETILTVIQYKKANPALSCSDISKKSEQLFGKQLTKENIQMYLSGRTKLFEEEFPVGGITYETYRSMVNIP